MLAPERQSEASFGRDCVFSPCKLNRPKHLAVRALGSCRQHSPGTLGPSITAGMSKVEASLCSHQRDPHGRQAMISDFASSASASTLSIAAEQR